MKLNELPLFFLDLQTTGAKPESGAHILEMAWSTLDSEIESSIVALPEGEKVPYRIQMITGIFTEDLDTALSAEHLFGNIEEKYKDHHCVIHFAQFEKPFLADAYEKLQREMPFPILCTHEIAKRLLPNLPTRGIKGLAGYFGLPSGDLKRSAHQVEATRVIWKGLVGALAEKGIHTFDDLSVWMQDTPKAKRTKYEYPLPKEKRLELPDQPGVYRMVSKWNEILYVGKATSLKSRVNSYFRGQKNRDPRKLEMLTQVYDLQVTVCGSPLEAALLETDEIKRLDPRYNISLKVGARGIVFFNRDFSNLSFEQDEEFCVGPFSSAMVFDSVRNLADCLASAEFHDNIFFEPIDADLVKEGFALFCERHGLEPYTFTSVRSILALGIWWDRQEKFVEEELEEEIESEETSSDKLVLLAEFEDANSSSEEEEEDIILTAEDIADKFERHFVRAGRAYLRAKELTKILNSNIDFKIDEEDPQTHYQLKIRKGFVTHEATAERVKKVQLWKGLDIDTYDRMSVLLSELMKIQSHDGVVTIQPL
ncbi:exonuclease domain-containing protein [Bdellovibrio sp. NC01]|uniref:exonuclease domain-containing protein n=1 Tax=Bdellovibrio sp. NC01 TaxID=2220073 RepID=UPI00115C0234|nr:exonuclease domain-containing protein [Bdellovibrio sp. NC01]QDK39555.1 excinuclease ABC subunit C [Bdellovibrio sp. NC01]